MLQLQYYNSNLNKSQINSILENYKMKYTGIKNEIDVKVNNFFKLVIKDILAFLENIEEVVDQKKKINEYEINKKELELARTKLKSYSYNAIKLQNDLDIVKQENYMLKLNIKSLKEKLNYLSNSHDQSNISFSKNKRSPYNLRESRNKNKSTDILLSATNLRSVKKKDICISVEKKKLNSSLSKDISMTSIMSLEKVFSKTKKGKNNKYKQNESKFPPNMTSIKIYESKAKKVNPKKYVNFSSGIKKSKPNKLINNPNNKTSSTKKNISVNSSVLDTIIPKTNLNNQNKNNKIKKFKEFTESNDSLIKSISRTYDLRNETEDISKDINTMIEEELSELEKDENNIKLLLDQIGTIIN